MAYSPKYVTDLTEIPVQIPDDYTKSEKTDALEVAEGSLELDLNNGNEIPSGDFVPVMKTAIKQKATCELARGAEDSTSFKMGDLSDDGTTKADYAQTYCDRYDELVNKMLDEGVLESGESRDPYTYATSDPNAD